MWGANIAPQQTRDSRRNPWHDDEYIQDGREEVVTPPRDSDEIPDGTDLNAGTWGERDGGRLNTRTAADDLNVLREELASLSRTRSAGAQSERNDGLFKTISRKSTRQNAPQSERNDGLLRTISRKSTRQTAPHRPSTADYDHRRTSSVARTDTADKEADDEPGDIGAVAAEKEDDFELGEFMKEGHFEKRKDGESTKKVGVVYKNLTVKGVGSTATFARTLPDAIMGTFGPDLYHLVSGWIPALRMGRHKQTRTLIHDFSGVVKEVRSS